MHELPARLRRLPRLDPPPLGAELRVATTARARLLGLAGLPALPPGVGLLLPGCRSIHTFGMRFALDLHWLDRHDTTVRVDRAVPPRRVRTCLKAHAVIELGSNLTIPSGDRPSAETAGR